MPLSGRRLVSPPTSAEMRAVAARPSEAVAARPSEAVAARPSEAVAVASASSASAFASPTAQTPRPRGAIPVLARGLGDELRIDDVDGDLSEAAAIRSVLAIRAKRARGEATGVADLPTYTRTITGPGPGRTRVRLLRDREFHDDVFAAMARAEDSILIANLAVGGTLIGPTFVNICLSKIDERDRYNEAVLAPVARSLAVDALVVPEVRALLRRWDVARVACCAGAARVAALREITATPRYLAAINAALTARRADAIRLKPAFSVYVAPDQFGSGVLFPWSDDLANLRRLEAAGAHVAINQSVRYTLWDLLGNFLGPTDDPAGLEHRKLAIIDGRVSYIGGTCFEDHYAYNDAVKKAYAAVLAAKGTSAQQKQIEAYWRVRYGDAYVDAQKRWLAAPDYAAGRRIVQAYFEARYPAEAAVRFEAWQRDMGGTAFPEPEEIATGKRPDYADHTFKHWGRELVNHHLASYMRAWVHRNGTFEPQLSDVELVERFFNRSGAAAVPPGEPGVVAVRSAKLVHSVPGGASEMDSMLIGMLTDLGPTDHVKIHMAYIMSDGYLEALKQAVMRGVHIEIFTNSLDGTDNKWTWGRFNSRLQPLLAAGAAAARRLGQADNVLRVHYASQYVHLKVISINDRWVWGSTGNSEYFSVHGGWDESAIYDSPELAAEAERRVFAPFRDRVEASVEQTLPNIAARQWPRRLLEWWWALAGNLMYATVFSRDSDGNLRRRGFFGRSP